MYEKVPQFKFKLAITYCINVPTPIAPNKRMHTAISIKVVPEQSGKVEYEREKLAGRDD